MENQQLVVYFPTLLPNLFTYRLQMIYKLVENTARELLFGVYKYQRKKERKVRV